VHCQFCFQFSIYLVLVVISLLVIFGGLAIVWKYAEPPKTEEDVVKKEQPQEAQVESRPTRSGLNRMRRRRRDGDNDNTQQQDPETNENTPVQEENNEEEKKQIQPKKIGKKKDTKITTERR